MSLETLIREPKIVTVAGQQIEIIQIRPRELFKVLKVCTPIIGSIQQMLASTGFGQMGLIFLLAEHGEDVLDFISICTRKEMDWVDGLEQHELLLVLGAVIEKNANFFAEVVLPALLKIMESLGKVNLAVMDGTKPSNA